MEGVKEAKDRVTDPSDSRTKASRPSKEPDIFV